jgi:hypothetical protein
MIDIRARDEIRTLHVIHFVLETSRSQTTVFFFDEFACLGLKSTLNPVWALYLDIEQWK